MKTAIYGRVSTSKQENENQLLQLRQFAASQKWEIVVEYTDETTGSGKKVRPAFQQMFQDASQRKFDCVLFWSLDRLSREGVLETLQYLQRLTSYGVAWRSFTEQYLDSTGIFRDAVISILAVVAKQERVRISERVNAGLQRARTRGVRLGSPRRELDVAQIRRLRTAGMSWRAIGRELDVDPTLALRAFASTHQNPAVAA
jgi:DNA invertase Pin-like site-specific DNA recombinase